MAKTRKCPRCGAAMVIKSEDWGERDWICPECGFFDDDIKLLGCAFLLACVLGFPGIIIGIAAFIKYHMTVYQAGVFVTVVFVVIPTGVAVYAKWCEKKKNIREKKKTKKKTLRKKHVCKAVVLNCAAAFLFIFFLANP